MIMMRMRTKRRMMMMMMIRVQLVADFKELFVPVVGCEDAILLLQLPPPTLQINFQLIKNQLPMLFCFNLELLRFFVVCHHNWSCPQWNFLGWDVKCLWLQAVRFGFDKKDFFELCHKESFGGAFCLLPRRKMLRTECLLKQNHTERGIWLTAVSNMWQDSH